ncbi:MAG: PD-(D/E)XK nuclease family protein [Azoarcus sp.]|nr:PD-(D/E)XK nuclease family protein [Azoarcus sp.]
MTTQVIGTVRASSWPSLFDCAHRWYWQNIAGLRMPSSGAAALGTAIHAGTAQFDGARIAGREASIKAAVDSAATVMGEEIKKGAAFEDTLTPKDAINYAINLTAKYCQTVAPTRQYTDVELSCTALDISTESGVVRITGTTDRIRVDADGRLGVSDLKSGGRATEKTADGGRRAVTKGHHIQLGIYTLMAEQASGKRLDATAEIIGLQTTKECPVATGEVADVKTPLLGTDDAPGLIEIAAQMLKAGVFPRTRKAFCAASSIAPHGRTANAAITIEELQ